MHPKLDGAQDAVSRDAPEAERGKRDGTGGAYCRVTVHVESGALSLGSCCFAEAGLSECLVLLFLLTQRLSFREPVVRNWKKAS